MLRVHVISETAYVTKGQGVHTAFIEHLQLLRKKTDIEVVVNQEGWGDVMHAHTYGLYYFWKGRKYKGRRIHTAHVIPESIKGSLPFWKYLMPLSNRFFKRVFSYADVVIALSPMVEESIRNLGVKSKIVKIYNPVLTERWTKTAEKAARGRALLKLKTDRKVVLGVGQLQSRKGVEDFISIAEAIPEADFIWIGGRPFGKLTEGVERINNRIKKASAHIHFPGLFDMQDMPDLYAAADIFLFPSYQENCPLAPLEAAASGLPVVYRDILEYQKLYENPYLKAADNASFIAQIKKLLQDERFYEDGKAISANLIKQFDQDKIRQQLIEVYQDLTGRKV